MKTLFLIATLLTLSLSMSPQAIQLEKTSRMLEKATSITRRLYLNELSSDYDNLLKKATVSTRRLHPEALGPKQKAAFEVAFKAEEAHLAAQRKFHTSELGRYENRDKQYAEEEATWANSSDDFKTKLSKVLKTHKEFIMIERNMNKTIKTNQRARNPLIKTRQTSYVAALRTKGRRLDGDENEVNEAFKKYMDTAKTANDSEKAFHTVEFREFDERQACVETAKKTLENDDVDKHDFVRAYGGCLRKVTKDIKRAIVNVADKKRKVDRKDVNKLWVTFVRAGRTHVRTQRKAERKLQTAGLTDAQKTAWEAAFTAIETHLAAQTKFHTSELGRYEERGKRLESEKEAWGSNEDLNVRIQDIHGIHQESVKTERALNKVINANKRARKGPLKARHAAINAAASSRRLQAPVDSDESALTTVFMKYHDTALGANKAELAFHHVEFSDFEAQQKCVNIAREEIKTATNNKKYGKTFKRCLRKVR